MGRRKKHLGPHGVLVLNKPSGPTSAGCLNTLKKGLDIGKIGHAGTLDPLAEGVLLVMLGSATKIAPYLTDGEKIYAGELKIGLTTDTYDIQGKVTEEFPLDDITPEMVAEEVEAWMDLTEQAVPGYSAAKHKGKPLYALAREGKETPVKIKPVTIFETRTLETDLPFVRFRVRCSAGTYIRSLVHSLGMRLGCGATMTALTREASSPFTLEQAHDLDALIEDPEGYPEKVIPLADALPRWKRITLGGKHTALVKNGHRLPTRETGEAGDTPEPGDKALFLDEQGTALALVECIDQNKERLWAVLRGLWS